MHRVRLWEVEMRTGPGPLLLLNGSRYNNRDFHGGPLAVSRKLKAVWFSFKFPKIGFPLSGSIESGETVLRLVPIERVQDKRNNFPGYRNGPNTCTSGITVRPF